MRKSLLIAAMAGLAIVGCTENELDQSVKSQQAISFSVPVLSNTTKANVYGELKNPYDKLEHFSVYAMYHEGDYVSSTASTNLATYFANVDAAYDDAADVKGWSTGKGSGNKYYYWPKKEGAKLTFAAYSPTGLTGTIGWTAASGFTLTGFTVADVTSGQYDLMFTKREKNQTASTGGTNYAGVDMNFEHALSSIVFTAKKDAEYTGTTVKLKKITLLNVYSKGSYTQGLKDDASNVCQNGYPCWGNWDTEKDYVVYENAGAELTTSAVNKNDNDVILIPQAFKHSASSEIKVKIDYSIKTETGAEIEQTNTVSLVTGNNGGYFTDGTNNIEGWAIGKRYTYNIVFSFDKIYFSPEVTDWADVTALGGVTF